MCPWKGTAADFDVVIGDDVLSAAFHYPEPKPAAEITGRLAFWGDVELSPGASAQRDRASRGQRIHR